MPFICALEHGRLEDHVCDRYPCFLFIASRYDIVELQTGLLAASALPLTDLALYSRLVRTPAMVRAALTQVATCDCVRVVHLPVSSTSVGRVPRGSRSRQLASAVLECDRVTPHHLRSQTW